MKSDSELRVLIVDDSAVYRRILREVISNIDSVSVCGVAGTGSGALEVLETKPMDVVLLDVVMPGMNGLETLLKIKKLYPEVVVVVISGYHAEGFDLTFKTLEAGAFDFITKPSTGSTEDNINALTVALKPIFRHIRQIPRRTTDRQAPVKPAARKSEKRERKLKPKLVVIGVSTGGPNALAEVIPHLPANLRVPVLVVIHMPPLFTGHLAKTLDSKSTIKVVEAVDGMVVTPGLVTIAPGGSHMTIKSSRASDRIHIKLVNSPPVNNCRPSVDVLFRSVAASFGADVLSVIMTGMGHDGLDGVAALKRKNCYSITQSRKSCVVYGMPRSVDENGLSDERVPLRDISTRIVELIDNGLV